MLKSLFATCLTALSVNTQPLAVSSSIEPSRSISEGTTFNVGDYVQLSVTLLVDESNVSLALLENGDNGINTLTAIDFSFTGSYMLVNNGGYPLFDYSEFVTTFTSDKYNTNLSFFYCDNASDDDCNFSHPLLDNGIDFTYSFTFEILEGFEGFNSQAFPYLTKVEKPYTPPSKSNLYRLLYDFYYSIFNDDDLTAITTGYNMPFDNWLAHTCTIATLITLIVVAFFFLRWLFRVISGLVLLKR